MNGKLELVLDVNAVLAEGPCWDADNQLLYWVDIDGKKVHIYNPITDIDRSIDIGQHVGAIAIRKSGGAVLAMHHGFYFLDTVTGGLNPVYDPESDLPDNRFNDGKCDAAGRFWAGTQNFEEKEPLGTLYCMETDHSVRAVLKGITISNGITWSPDNKIMYYIDSATRQVVAFDYDIKTGAISNKRVVVRIPYGGGTPDGMTSDIEGMLWVAQWGGWQVSRWNPYTGELIDSIQVPVERVSSCIFGGKDMDELYITTARRGVEGDEIKRQPHAGGIFRVKTNVKGIMTYKYAG